MLQHLHIKNLAIVTALEVEFQPGMTTLTGETGAGKSILIDALGLVLGDRADNGMIRSGRDQAEITAVFTLNQLPRVTEWLQTHALDNGDQCILRRVLTRNSSSRAFINGSPVPVKSLHELGDQLVDIHSQHAHQSLLRRDHQRQLLDEFAGNIKHCHKTALLFGQWKQSEEAVESLQEASRDRTERIELLQYQINELKVLQLGTYELQTLDEEHHRLSNAGQLMESCNLILATLDDDDTAVTHKLNLASRELNTLLSVDPDLRECREMLETASIQIQETVSNLREYGGNLQLDPAKLNQLDHRLSEIQDLSRKYRCRPEELLEQLDGLERELEQLKNADIHLSELELQAAQLQSEYLKNAGSLDKNRKKAADKLGRQVTTGIRSLDMAEGVVEIKVETLAKEKASRTGLNQIDFLVSTNPGQSPQPLNKVASGGELSRISLAIQVATINCDQTPTLIFDEVDVGIGGGMAEIVGRLLRQLGKSRQLLCVTHLPQVASLGHQHYQIRKESDASSTNSIIVQLDEQNRVHEIARMLGGLEITDQTIAHAKEMINLPVN